MSVQAFGREFEAVVFDVDGVLLDTASGWARAEEAFCAAFSVAYTPQLATGTHGAGVDESVAVLTSGVPGPVDADAAAALLRSLADEHVPRDFRLMQGTLEAIEHIQRWVPVAIASNSERPLLERLLEASGHAAVVDVVISATDVAAPKPAPDVYLAATARLGVAPAATLVVEDSPTGAAAALAAGCSVVHFGAGPTTPTFPGAVGTVSDHRDLLLRLGLQPPAHLDGRGRA